MTATVTSPVLGATAEQVAQLLVSPTRVRRRLGLGESAPIGASGVSALAEVVREGPLRLGGLAARERRIDPATLSRVVAGLVTATDAGQDLVSTLRSDRAEQLAVRLAQLAPEARLALLSAGPALARLVAVTARGPSPRRRRPAGG